MQKFKVEAHPSVAIIKSKDSDEFLFARYDSTYPAIPYRLASNTLGGNPKAGNPKAGDLSPFLTWQREVEEEFNNVPPKGEELRDENTPFAPLDEIIRIRNSVLENAVRYGDFYFVTYGLKKEDYLNGVGKGLSEESLLSMLSNKKINELNETGMIMRTGKAIFSVFYSEIPTEDIEKAKSYLSKGMRLTTEGGNRILTKNELVHGITGEIE